MQHLASMDEAYLVTISNKGTYKRALKELDSTEIGITTMTADQIIASFPDGVSVEITAAGQACSCPSREVCKHIVMAILAAQKVQHQSGGQTTPLQNAESAPNFDALLAETVQSLEKRFSKKLFKKTIFMLETGATATIEEGTTLAIALSSGYSVHFLPDTTSKCSCKARDICEHRAEAILHYIKHRTGNFPEGLFDREQTDSAVDMDVVPFMLDFAHRFMSAGLARASAEYKRQFEHLAVLCHSRRLANHERLCNRIAGQLEYMEQRSTSFSTGTLLGYLCDFINLCRELMAGHNTSEIVGSFRDEYFMIPDTTLYGLGADSWESVGGYRGVTAYFYSEERQAVLTYTAALPIERASDIQSMYHGELWGISIASACKGALRLHKGKLSQHNQLSASAESKAQTMGGISFTAIAPSEVSDFSTLPDILWGRKDRSAELILTAFSYGEAEFNAVKQTLYLPVRDGAGRELMLSARYKDIDKTLIDNIKSLHMQPQKRLLIRLYLDGGEMRAYPISLIGDVIISLSLDSLNAAKTSKYYNW
ncbi:MAG: SWIM zinc finger family protein [Deferribacteraceae bacterium]|jgi:hypothetical protein|nr:SWIM zinc finger family protein [Deferribacteraceae bacterium]